MHCEKRWHFKNFVCILILLCSSQNTLLTVSTCRRIQSQLDIPFALHGALIGRVLQLSAGEVTPIGEKWRIRKIAGRQLVSAGQKTFLNCACWIKKFTLTAGTRNKTSFFYLWVWHPSCLVPQIIIPAWFWGRNRPPAVYQSVFARCLDLNKTPENPLNYPLSVHYMLLVALY